jgi:hypothetical protein
VKNLKHTPGPWKLEKHKPEPTNGCFNTDLQIWSRSEFIAAIPFSLVAKREANAALIAAAPEMLEALEWVKTCVEAGAFRNEDRETPDIFKVEQAIAKARGE